MTEAHPEIIIIKRHAAHEEEHHGGAWKIAFADFMTAMMAFFLVLWIISATDKNTKTLIARYFNPVKVEEPAKAQKGIHGAPEKGAVYAAEDGNGGPNAGQPSSEHGEGPAEKGNENQPSPSKQNEQARPPTPSPLPPPDPAKALSDNVGAGIVQRPSRESRQDRWRAAAGPSHRSFGGAEGLRRSGAKRRRGLARSVPSAGQRQSRQCGCGGSGRAAGCGCSKRRIPFPFPFDRDRASGAGASGPAQAQGGAEAPGAGSPAPSMANPPAPDPVAARQTAASNLLADLNKRLAGESKSMQGPQLDVQATEDEILISLTDRQNFSMFPIGSAEPQPRVLHMMEAIAASLQNLQGAIVVRGHTDGRPYRSATYDNWRLSSARAQMAYYMLICGGLPEKRFERVEGYANHSLKDPSHPLAAENRRIEILVRAAKP